MAGVFLMRLDEIQPSQLFISSEKLAAVMKNFDPARPETLEPVPVKQLGNQVIFTDGHTRAFAAFLGGLAAIPVYWDEDELDWEAYEICVQWCHEAGIRTIADLKGRVVSHDEYEVVWYQRCEEMQQALAGKRLTRD